MIIDTCKIDPKELRTIAHIIHESHLIPDENGVFQAEKQNSHCGIYYEDFIRDGKSQYQIGFGGESFSVHGEHNDYKMDKKERKRIKSLKGFPTHCGQFRFNDYVIDDIDYLPKADKYHMSKLQTKKITYPFPEKIQSLWMTKVHIKSFNNFPKVIEEDIHLNGIKAITSKNFPVVNGQIDIENCAFLRDLDNLKGDYEEIKIDKLKKLESIGYLSKTAKKVNIYNCPILTDVDGLLNLTEDCELYITECPNIDPYTALQCKADLQYNAGFGPGFQHFYTVFYELDKKDSSYRRYKMVEDPRGLTREEMELKVVEFWGEDVRTSSSLKSLRLKTKLAIEKRKNILASQKGIKKYKL
jgi:hypothetical protein